MRDRRKFCRPKLTTNPHLGDVVIKLKCGSNGIVSYDFFKNILDYFKIESFVGSTKSKTGNILSLNTDFDQEGIFTPEIFSRLNESFTLDSIIGNKNTPEEGDLLAYNSILETTAVFSPKDIESLDSSWEIKGLEGIDTYSKQLAKVGDILIGASDTKLIIDYSNYSKVKSNWEALGIVAVESKNTPDSKLRIVSLDYMDYNNPTTGNLGSGISMMWGANGDISGLTNRNQVPCLSVSSSSPELTTEIQRAIDFDFIPTNYFTGTQSKTDGYKYWNGIEASASYAGRYCPPAYLDDGTINPLYVATKATVPGTSTEILINNSLAELDGKYNTEQIMKKCTATVPINSVEAGNYPAAHCCTLYNKGKLSWYLPAHGELGLIVSNFKLINSARVAAGYSNYNYNSYWFWSSTLFNSFYARSVYGNSGYCYSSSRSYTNGYSRVLAVCAF